MNVAQTEPRSAPAVKRPRLGFLGLGWIGRHRLASLAASGEAEIAALADPIAGALESAARLAPEAACGDDLEMLLAMDLDGIVIATPSALHAEQSIAALDRGFAVFCQKPLARSEAETRRVVAAARRADRLLGVDFSYRHVDGLSEIRGLIQTGEFGKLYAMNLTFHNAYGPDQPWFYDRRLSGGGCVMDLGIHLLDLALWMNSGKTVSGITSRLFRKGHPLPAPTPEIEDYATVHLDFDDGSIACLECSWGLSAGQDAVIEFRFHGSSGGAALRNVNGSFHDFLVERFQGTRRSLIAGYPDAWGGRALLEWTQRLAAGKSYSREAEQLVNIARLLDAIYDRTTQGLEDAPLCL